MREPAGSLSILMVDDDRVTAEMYSSALRRNGHVVRVAVDGWSGLREALQDPPDLLVLDLHLPVIDGHAVLGLLRQHAGLGGLPAVMLSNNDSVEVLRRSRELGALAHLVKCETTPARLCGLVRDWCQSGLAASSA